MKKLQILLVLLCFSSLLYAQKNDFTGYKIFINPGHGGHDSDDRHIVATDFWESEGNLTKGLYLQTLLKKLNATTYISRTTNTTADDLALSAISAMANTANADIFLSIHSNGYQGNSNYLLTLFRGYDNSPVYPKAKDFATIVFQKLFEKSNYWTNTTTYIKGDWTFYPDWGTQGLGVLRNLSMPGVLSEGSFHDYIGESWRLKNEDYLKHEAVALTRAFMEYDGVKGFPHGVIAGVVRDPLQKPGYYYVPGKIDEKLPLNGVKVTLKETGKKYITDNLNNGFFYFDSIPPGNYKLYFEGAANYKKDSLSITVTANKTAIADKELSNNTSLVPNITGRSPLTSANVPLNQEWIINFDISMLPSSLASAITVTPSIKLNYTWSNNNRTLSIKPETIYAKNTDYTINISNTLCSQWNVAMQQAYQFKFTTLDRKILTCEGSYPQDKKTGLSTLPQFRLFFDAPLDQASASANIILTNASNNIVSKTREEFVTKGAKGEYYFEPLSALSVNTDYKIVLKSDLTDNTGTKLGQDITINFKTRTNAYPTGTVVVNYDDVTGFWDPNQSGSTVGTDADATTFTLATNRKVSGSGSGKLDYKFTGTSGGVCRVHNSNKPSVGSDSKYKIGVWIFGDLSYNQLEYWFYRNNTSSDNVMVTVGPIDWAGWELKTIPFADIQSTGNTLFHSIVVTQLSGGATSGTIYCDDMQLLLSTGTPEISDPSVDFRSFPNPFKTISNIQYTLTEPSRVCIDVYNLLGQKINTIYNDSQSAGTYTQQWDGKSKNGTRQPGIYIYRIDVTPSGNASNHFSRSIQCVVQ